jgi:hypothetical protein
MIKTTNTYMLSNVNSPPRMNAKIHIMNAKIRTLIAFSCTHAAADKGTVLDQLPVRLVAYRRLGTTSGGTCTQTVAHVANDCMSPAPGSQLWLTPRRARDRTNRRADRPTRAFSPPFEYANFNCYLATYASSPRGRGVRAQAPAWRSGRVTTHSPPSKGKK